MVKEVINHPAIITFQNWRSGHLKKLILSRPEMKITTERFLKSYEVNTAAKTLKESFVDFDCDHVKHGADLRGEGF